MILGATLLTALALCLVIYGPPYSPPPFEESAKIGKPKPPDNLNYGEIRAEGGFAFSMAGTMFQQEDGSLLLYLTNHEDSGINLMCSVTGKSGEVLYKSGLLRPGEYAERLFPQKKIGSEAMDIEINVYGFEPETYFSKGTVTLSNRLQPW
jgi:hypothetical protein